MLLLSLSNFYRLLTELDECDRRADPPLHDCDPNASCYDTDGYFQCVCYFDYKDKSPDRTYMGRSCEGGLNINISSIVALVKLTFIDSNAVRK